jgi:hypothetical protein
MKMKPYFCCRCGREYQHDECLHDGSNMYCYDCPTSQLRIGGWPLIFIGIFIGVMFWIYEAIPVDTVGGPYIFIPVVVGLILAGALRLVQAQHLRRDATIRQEKEQAEKEQDAVPVNAPVEPLVETTPESAER